MHLGGPTLAYTITGFLQKTGRGFVNFPESVSSAPGVAMIRPSGSRAFSRGLQEPEAGARLAGHYGRNPALLMPKMEFTSDVPGGPNLMCCCVRLPNFRGRLGLGCEAGAPRECGRLSIGFDRDRFQSRSVGNISFSRCLLL